jgi:hypothetical protein
MIFVYKQQIRLKIDVFHIVILSLISLKMEIFVPDEELECTVVGYNNRLVIAQFT